jgi:acyl-CoA hydrolase
MSKALPVERLDKDGQNTAVDQLWDHTALAAQRIGTLYITNATPLDRVSDIMSHQVGSAVAKLSEQERIDYVDDRMAQ